MSRPTPRRARDRRGRSSRLLLALLLTLPMLLPLPWRGPAPVAAQTPVAADPVLESRLAALSDEVAAVRDLPPLASRDDRLISRDALRADLPRQLREENPPEKIAAITRSSVALGLLPPGEDALADMLAILGDQIAGYYDPRTKQMFVVADGGGLTPSGEFTYVHETVHALTDAAFTLEQDPGGGANDDAALAYGALAEGDATAASLVFLADRPDLLAGLAGEGVADSGLVDRMPPALTLPLFFPYVQGTAFVDALRAEGGWDRVDAAYADPPVSTEQVIHPEKYLAREAPVPLALPDGSALGPAWATVDENTLGELMTAVLLADLRPGQVDAASPDLGLPLPARNAAAGWGGDRYALWSDGASDVLVWRSAWDSERDAIAFSRALAARESARWGAAFDAAAPADLTLATADVAARIVVAGRDVLYVQAPDPALAARALAAAKATPSVPATPLAAPLPSAARAVPRAGIDSGDHRAAAESRRHGGVGEGLALPRLNLSPSPSAI